MDNSLETVALTPTEVPASPEVIKTELAALLQGLEDSKMYSTPKVAAIAAKLEPYAPELIAIYDANYGAKELVAKIATLLKLKISRKVLVECLRISGSIRATFR